MLHQYPKSPLVTLGVSLTKEIPHYTSLSSGVGSNVDSYTKYVKGSTLYLTPSSL